MIRPHTYTPEEIQFLEKNIKGRSFADLTGLFNRRFRLSITYNGIKTFCQRRGLKNGYKPKTSWNKTFFEKHIRFLEKTVPGRHYSESVVLFNRRFGFSLTVRQLTSLCKRLGIKTGFTGQFPKGNVSFNKGKKGVYHAGCEVSWFKKGQKPWTTLPLGSERVTADGYVEVNISEKSGPPNNRWKGKHIMVWEKEHGPVPKGHCVIFLDGNRSNISLDNLMMVSRQVHGVMCHMDWYTDDRDITKANCLMASIKATKENLRRKSYRSIKNKKIIFLNENGNKVYVIKNKNKWIPVRETSAGNLVRLRVKELKSRASRGEAQRDLYEYATSRKWMRI